MVNVDSIKAIFEPESVAVIGASRDPSKVGHELLRNLVNAGFRGKIFAINPQADQVLGKQAFRSIKDVPEHVDLAIIAIPARFVPVAVKECVEVGCNGAVIISGGFREVGHAGEELEKEVRQLTKPTGMRVVGPNCQGINNPHSNLCATWPLVTSEGSLSMISQSGTVGAAFQWWAQEEGLGISKYSALGNKVDVNEIDLVQYFGQDPQTRVIAAYLEGTSNGKEFVRLGREISKTKPIVVLKSGRTEGGIAAAASHTKSLAGRDEVFGAALERMGAIRVDTIEELYDSAKALGMLRLPEGNKLLVITTSGGAGILAVDACESLGLDLPEISFSVADMLRSKLPSQCVIRNPLDLTTAGFDPQVFAQCIRDTENEPFNMVLTIFGDPIQGVAEAIGKVVNETRKVVIVAYIGGAQLEQTETVRLHSIGVPVFPTPDRAAKAINALCKYASWRRHLT